MSVMNDMLESEFQLKQEIESLRQQLAECEKQIVMLRNLLSRYRNETPVGNQPHMICHEVDEALAATDDMKEQEK